MDSKILRVELVDRVIVQVDMFDEQPFESFINKLFEAVCRKYQYKCLNAYRQDLDQHMTFAVGVGELKVYEGKAFTEDIYNELASAKYTRDDVLNCLIEISMDIKKVPENTVVKE